MLGKAFVKIQKQDDKNSYAGCGFFVDTEHIVTCAHVLDTANGDEQSLKKGQILTADMPFIDLKDIAFELIDYVPQKDGKITFNESDDVALLKLKLTTHTKISEPQIKIPRAYTENKRDITIYSQKTKDWIEGQTKAPTEEGWLEISVESKVENGDSGSPVWNEKLHAITGMLVARKRKGLT